MLTAGALLILAEAEILDGHGPVDRLMIFLYSQALIDLLSQLIDAGDGTLHAIFVLGHAHLHTQTTLFGRVLGAQRVALVLLLLNGLSLGPGIRLLFDPAFSERFQLGF